MALLRWCTGTREPPGDNHLLGAYRAARGLRCRAGTTRSAEPFGRLDGGFSKIPPPRKRKDHLANVSVPTFEWRRGLRCGPRFPRLSAARARADRCNRALALSLRTTRGSPASLPTRALECARRSALCRAQKIERRSFATPTWARIAKAPREQACNGALTSATALSDGRLLGPPASPCS